MKSAGAMSKRFNKQEISDFVKEYNDKRTSPRDSHEQPVRVYLCDENELVLDYGFAKVKDLSIGGLCIEGLKLSKRTEIQMEHRFLLEIIPGDSILLEVRTCVRWQDIENDQLGLEFEEIRKQIL
ncbi:MAG: PilZ domain-containing protein [Planctomycetes bacterium]|nr:PilZ domain-containing protein [Planctomycetota bacterium]